MSTTINTIKETGKVHALPPKVPISRVKAISGDNIFAIGGVTQKNIQVTCTITRYFRDLKDGLTAWTRTLFCLADDTGIWTANIGGLTEGIYVLAFGAEGEDIDCAVIEVPAKKITRPFTAITDTSALP